jgi:hypothetical protein
MRDLAPLSADHDFFRVSRDTVHVGVGARTSVCFFAAKFINRHSDSPILQVPPVEHVHGGIQEIYSSTMTFFAHFSPSEIFHVADSLIDRS